MEAHPKSETNPAQHKRNWLLQGGTGLALVGAGYCVAWEAGHAKHARPDTLGWVGKGTLGLVILNAGLSIFGNAILERVRYEAKTEWE